jgi:hypothetical protein
MLTPNERTHLSSPAITSRINTWNQSSSGLKECGGAAVKMVALKDRYDSASLFRLNQNIRPNRGMANR